MKAAPVERVIRTIFNKIARAQHVYESKAWLPFLDDVVESYNQTIHSAHGYKPAEVNEENSQNVWDNLFQKYAQEELQKPLFKTGDKVRISKRKLAFEKGYDKSWSEEIYRIERVLYTKPIVYKLESIKGTFYEQELLKVGV